MTTIAAQNPMNILDYGAAAFKKNIEFNTRRAFYVTMALLLLLALFNFTFPLVEDWLFPRPRVVKVRLAKVSLDALPPPPSNANEPPPPPPPAIVPPAAGPAARAGAPVAVPDAQIAEDVKDFANIDEINRASSIGGDGTDFGGWSDNIGVGQDIQITEREEEPDLDEFIAVEVEPQFDYDELRRRVKYPDIAQRNGIEGQVLVGALVGKDGRVAKTQIIMSDNSLLDQEAVRVVKETVFTPAIQNGNAVQTWVRIPIKFVLR